ncbi:P1 family peptidase [Limimaricola pyoseonensis]|uniref:D-aminopeptidase n=1 Tax=Limimaricola pyoseonensis TaxID=521013 RepID=A0A1G7JJ67_9RHOB|nr:P1 family peptidase [Limimaricola pyoseonensis]SDF24936.1 D-aminopeptidase [Limimaricola pyoseonensis]
MTARPVVELFPDAAWGRSGASNSITDVAGVSVGHCTLREGGINTGVTAVRPHGGNAFLRKSVAAAHVINGFGKSVGLPQIRELGQLETPILLTNTLSVPACSEALIRQAILENPEIGRSLSTVNAVVGECNDGPLNDIQRLAVRPEHACAALAAAAPGPVAQGSVGAGTGMTCFGFKGGIGTSSRILDLGGRSYTIGGLVVSNFGKPGALMLPGARRPALPPSEGAVERGSIMIVLATDLPLDARQLERVCVRAGAGLARLGSFYGNGSGDFVIGFSTQNAVAHDDTEVLREITRFNESLIDPAFEATAEIVQEAVLNSMLMAEAFMGFRGTRRPSLRDALDGSALR